jgi:hypothetical protein
MFILKSRRERESIIVKTMISIYCMDNHKNEAPTLCDACIALSIYAEKRLLSCMFGEVKPVCKSCPVHCYSPQKRELMKEVMRWSGPRMIYRKPVYAFIHFIDKLTIPRQKSLKQTKKTFSK